MEIGTKVSRPRRYKRALLRLASGKTQSVVWHVAKQLEADGLVTVAPDPEGSGASPSRSALICTLTEDGKHMALQAASGANPYAPKTAPRPAGFGLPRPRVRTKPNSRKTK